MATTVIWRLETIKPVNWLGFIDATKNNLEIKSIAIAKIMEVLFR